MKGTESMELFNKGQKGSNDGKEAWENILGERRHSIILIEVVITQVVYICQDLKWLHFVLYCN